MLSKNKIEVIGHAVNIVGGGYVDDIGIIIDGERPIHPEYKADDSLLRPRGSSNYNAVVVTVDCDFAVEIVGITYRDGKLIADMLHEGVVTPGSVNILFGKDKEKIDIRHAVYVSIHFEVGNTAYMNVKSYIPDAIVATMDYPRKE